MTEPLLHPHGHSRRGAGDRSDPTPFPILWEPARIPHSPLLRPGTLRVGTLGPDGTTSMVALGRLGYRLAHLGGPEIEAVPYDSFEELLAAVGSRGGPSYALVPGAAECATRFFWSPRLRLDATFSSPTPEYGIASYRTGLREGILRLATLHETRRLVELLDGAEGGRGGYEIAWVPAESTMHAAQLVTEGRADAAVTNEPGRAAHRLEFQVSRPGVPMVWMVFGPAVLARPGATTP
ncbi:bacilysin biosynthesis protein BacA [Streptomyces sp. 840.1]|uniref:prephenate dehydratase n=1 Tax=Streptomyces sp. 840.1 TaxID=2485152 RepID=UPI000F483680|nr:prephenate dehydratase [Streptomyces sp. 840.1]ROQ68161.1 bacilysin biosynthesis protein BacA [Streptomyces sp. 840.1]